MLKIAGLIWIILSFSDTRANQNCINAALQNSPYDAFDASVAGALYEDLRVHGVRTTPPDSHLKEFIQVKSGIPVSRQTKADWERWLPEFRAAHISLLREPLLTEQQDASLFPQLALHGVDAEALGITDGRKLLVEVSRQNLQRWKSKATYVSTPELKEVENFLNEMHLSPLHQTHYEKKNPPGAGLLSSQRFLGMGIDFGLNTHPFNVQLLGSNDNVFFYPLLWPNPEPSQIKHKDYGKFGLHLNEPYAKKVGWISAFIMYPKDLAYFYGRAEYPEIYKRIREKIHLNGDEVPGMRMSGRRWDDNRRWRLKADGRRNKEIIRLAQDDLVFLRNTLSKFDFTVPDYLELLKNGVLFRLSVLKTENKAEFDRVIADLLSTKNPEYFMKLFFLVTELAQDGYGIGYFNFELKVPVAVPQSQLIAY